VTPRHFDCDGLPLCLVIELGIGGATLCHRALPRVLVLDEDDVTCLDCLAQFEETTH